MKVNLLDERGHDRPDEKKARQTAVGHPVICAPRITMTECAYLTYSNSARKHTGSLFTYKVTDIVTKTSSKYNPSPNQPQ